MTNQAKHIAILLFAQTAQLDAAIKSLPNTAIIDVLNNHVLDTIKSTGLDYYHIDQHKQRGNTFADRFTNAISDVFNLGYDSVICLGNDTPLLTHDLIVQSQQSLQHGNAVAGITTDGGLYLIGLNRNQFNAHQFNKLAWQSRQLTATFVDYITGLDQDVLLLKPLQDIDSTADLHHFILHNNTRLPIVVLLLITLSRKRNTYHPSIQQYTQPVQLQPANKGSPIH